MSDTVAVQKSLVANIRSQIDEDISKNERALVTHLSDIMKNSMTTDIIRDSGINKVLTELRKCSNDSVSKKSVDVIDWIKAELRGQNNGSNSNVVASTPMKRKLEEVNLNASKAGKVDNTASISKSSKFILGNTKDNVRDKAQQMIYDGLGRDDNDATEFRTELSVSIEQALYLHFHPDETNLPPGPEYRARLRIITGNLKDAKNTEFNQRIYYNEISPQDLATMSEHDMASSELKELRSTELKESMEARKTDLNAGSVGTDMFQCGKCKERKVTFYQRQTRSADEPMTIFLTCLNCRHRWRQY